MLRLAVKNGMTCALACLCSFNACAIRLFVDNAALANVSLVASPQSSESSTARTFEHYYKKMERIGKGGQGFVFRAERLQPGKPNYSIAVKEMDSGKNAQTEQDVMRLKLPFVADMEDAFESSGTVSLVTRLYEGGDVHRHFDYVKQNINRKEGYAVFKSWGEQMAYGLWVLHRNNILYRDFKADNTFVVDESRKQVVLSDFGLAKTGCEPKACSNKVVGTYGYMSPALATGRYYGYEADWWAHAVTLLVMATGTYPFRMMGTTGLTLLFKDIAGADGKNILKHITDPALYAYLSKILDRDAYAKLESNAERRKMRGKASKHPFLSNKFWHGIDPEDYPGDPRKYEAKVDAYWLDLCVNLAINKENCVTDDEEDDEEDKATCTSCMPLPLKGIKSVVGNTVGKVMPKREPKKQESTRPESKRPESKERGSKERGSTRRASKNRGSTRRESTK